MEMIESNLNSLKCFRSDLYRYLVHTQSGSIDQHSLQTSINEDIWQKSLKYSEIKNCRLLIINGCVPSEGIARIVQDHGSQVRQILFVCQSREKFMMQLSHSDYSGWIADERFEFCIGLEEKYLSAYLKDYFVAKDRLIYREKIGFFNFWPDLQSDGKYYVRFAEMVPQVLGQLQSNLIAPDEDAYRGFLNLNRNLSSGKSVGRVDLWKDSAKGRSAVLIASGPSLKFHLDHLKNLDERFVVGCSDSALKSVLEHGFEPHFCFSLERSSSIGRLFTEIPKNIRTVLVTLPICHPDVMKNFPEKIAFMMRQSAFSKWLWPDALMFNVGSSVSTMAIRFFAHLGISHVNLLGQDLAYDPISSHSHFGGVRQEILDVERERFNHGDWCELDSNSGKKIKSTIFWKTFLDEIKVNLTKFSITCTNVIPEQYGAFLEGAQRMDPEKFWSGMQDNEGSGFNVAQSVFAADQILDRDRYGQLTDEAINQLIHLKKKVLSYLDDMSVALLECFPESRSSNLMSYYEHKLNFWRGLEAEVLTDSVYVDLIKLMMVGSHLKFFTAREGIFFEDETFVSDISRHINITQEWLKNVVYWIERVSCVFKNN